MADLEGYRQACELVARMEQELEKAKERKSAAVKAILDAHGKGPHWVEGEPCVISNRGPIYFFKTLRKDARKNDPG